MIHAQNMIHELSLEKFYNNIKSLVKYLKVNHKILASCVESKSLILANILQVLKKSPDSKFNSYIGQFRNKYDDGTNSDLDNFIGEIVIKYKSWVEDGQWSKTSEKYVEILYLKRF